MKKFLIVKTSSLGDILHAYPVVDYLRQRFPDAKIDWAVEKRCASLVQAHPCVNQAICLDTQKWRKALLSKNNFAELRLFIEELRRHNYDAVFDLQGNMKSGFITWFSRSSHKVGFGWKTVHEWPNYFSTNCHYNFPSGCNIREDNLSIVKQFFSDTTPYHSTAAILGITENEQLRLQELLNQPILKNRKRVLVCPGSAWVNKQITEEALLDFLKRLQHSMDCAFLFAWGTKTEQLVAVDLQNHFRDYAIVLEKLSLPLLQSLMSRLDLVIAMDSLPLHLAGTTSTPTFSVFGSSLAAKYEPCGAHNHSFQGSCPYGRLFEKRCPILRTCSTGACIRTLSGKDVYEAFRHSRLED